VRKPTSTISFEAPKRVEIKENKEENIIVKREEKFISKKPESISWGSRPRYPVKVVEKTEKPDEIERKVVGIIKEDVSIDSDVLHAKF
jgi:hypothetical protein